MPSFLLLPPGPLSPDLLLFGTWHAEAGPTAPAAAEGSERLALAAILAGLAPQGRKGDPTAAGSARVAAVVHPAAGHGSRPLADLLAGHRERLRAPAAFWVRVLDHAPRRRRIFLGARGQVAIGIWGGDANPYRVRDEVVTRLRAEAYGPRPLDFELLRKLGQSRAALDFLEETLDDPGAVHGEGEDRLKDALFGPRGQVATPRVSHPDRPRAWLIVDGAERMESEEVLGWVRGLAPGSTVEMAEAYPWDRINIHHPAVRAQIALSKSVSEGPEIWPATPWVTPSGLFTRVLGTPLAEWGVPLLPGGSVRSPTPESFEAVVREVSDLIRLGAVRA
jgi:hypothetical protein